MTVGIAFTNGLEALVITDSRESGWGRQSDSVNKLGEFSNENYHGVIFAAGNSNIIEGIIKHLDNFEGDELQGYISSIQQTIKERENRLVERFFKNAEEDIAKKALLIPNKNKKKGFVDKETAKVMQTYDDFKHDPKERVTFILVAYDKNKKKIRQFDINSIGSNELFLPHVEIGSGQDGANMYFTTKLQGLDSTKLNFEELTFFVVNAYTLANVNIGVGGTPKIAHINEEHYKILPVDRTKALTNLSGAFLADYNQELSLKQIKDYFHTILVSENPPYDEIAHKLKINEETLITILIPYGSWQERTNTS